MPDAMKASDNYSRDYALGKQVSVTRQAPGEIKRLSVAVLLRQPDGKPRGKAEIAQIEQLVKAAVGYDASRSDQVRSEEHTSEPQSLMRLTYAVFCLKKKHKSRHK